MIFVDFLSNDHLRDVHNRALHFGDKDTRSCSNAVRLSGIVPTFGRETIRLRRLKPAG